MIFHALLLLSLAETCTNAARIGKTRGCTIENNVDPQSKKQSFLWGTPNPKFYWGKKYTEMLLRVDATMESLKSSGWPPVFVFLFDEPWLLIDRMFELVTPILGKDCVFESSMYGWALSRTAKQNVESSDTIETNPGTNSDAEVEVTSHCLTEIIPLRRQILRMVIHPTCQHGCVLMMLV